MAHQVKGRALWRRGNQQEQGLVIDHPRYADILNNKRPGLTKIVQPSYLWNHLRKYGVLDKEIQDEITVNISMFVSVFNIKSIGGDILGGAAKGQYRNLILKCSSYPPIIY